MNMTTDAVVIGAGASGLLCASEAGKRRRSVIVLDHAGRIGNKIRVSGGGHCNFTNRNVSHENYISSGNTDFCRSALSRFTPQHFIGIMDHYGINYCEKDDGQLFCAGSAGEIIRMLSQECRMNGVKIIPDCLITDIRRNAGKFVISTNKAVISSDSLVVATGGLSYPRLGASGFGYRIARQFELNVIPSKPALVPLIFSKSDSGHFSKLSGITVRARVSCKERSFTGMMLFTHRGVSGPAILQISTIWEKGETVSVDLFPDYDIHELFVKERIRRVEMKNILSGLIPSRLAHELCERYIQSKPMNQYSDRELREIATILHNWTIKPAGTEGYGKAEVTGGGVDTSELSSKTMEAKKVAGLYFIGEVVDVTGELGGYNLHWAWASGFVAGQYV